MWTDDPAKGILLGTQIRTTWVDSEAGVEEVLRWFADSAVISEIVVPKERAWISELVSSPDPKKVLLFAFYQTDGSPVGAATIYAAIGSECILFSF